MSRLEQLYQETILIHNRNPRHFKVIEAPSSVSHGVNPLCGDDYFLYLTVENGVVKDVGFQGHGCAISKASASMMTSAILGQPVGTVSALKDRVLDFLTHDESTAPVSDLGALQALAGVRNFPVRVKCATLIWRALEHGLAENAGPVSTE